MINEEELALRGLEHVVVCCSLCARNDVFLQRGLSPAVPSGLSGEQASVLLATLTRLLQRFLTDFPGHSPTATAAAAAAAVPSSSSSSSSNALTGMPQLLPACVVQLLMEGAPDKEDPAVATAAAAAEAKALAQGASPSEAAAAGAVRALRAGGGRVAGERRARATASKLDPTTAAALTATLAHRQEQAELPMQKQLDAEGRVDVTRPSWSSAPLPSTPVPDLGRLLDWARITVDATFPALLLAAAPGRTNQQTPGQSVGPSAVLRRLRSTVAQLTSIAATASELRGHVAHTMQRLPFPEAPLPAFIEQRIDLPW